MRKAPSNVLQFRVPKELYSELKKSAQKIGASLSSEAERHLERSIREKTNDDLEKMISRAVRKGMAAQHRALERLTEAALASSQVKFKLTFGTLNCIIVTPHGQRIIDLGDVIDQAARHAGKLEDRAVISDTIKAGTEFSSRLTYLLNALTKRLAELDNQVS